MNDHKPKLISIERAKTLLDCYGGDPAAWPEAERAAVIALLNQSEELQHHQREAQDLDGCLKSKLGDDNPTIPDSFLARLTEDLPPQEQRKPQYVEGSWLRKFGGIAALLVVTLSIVLVNEKPSLMAPELTEFDQWALAEMAQDVELESQDVELDLDVALLIGFDDVAL